MGRGHLRIAALLVTSAALLALPSATTAALTTNPPAITLARAIVADPAVVTGAEYVARPAAGTPVAVSSDPLGSFPTGGGEYGILTTGNATLAGTGNTSGSSGANLGGGNVRGNSDYDVVILRIDLDVPATANCLVGMDFRFLSEEYPEWVGSEFNDALIAEVHRFPSWNAAGRQDPRIRAPRNFATTRDGNLISVNGTGVARVSRRAARGTTYDAATGKLRASTRVRPGLRLLHISIFDQGDRQYDSTVLIDRLLVRRAAKCRSGVVRSR